MAVQRRRLLLVEDEHRIAAPLVEALESEGFETHLAGSVAESLELAGRLRPDLVLLDLMLPDGSGFDVCRGLRAESEVPIIMLTARGDEADRVVGLELGADDYVDSVGLADAPLRSVDSLAPERAERPAAGAAERARATRARARARRRQRSRQAEPAPAPPTTTPPATPTVDDHGGLTEPGDDRGGSNSGPGGGGSSGHGGGDD
jgi:CheY-like chemotaxis protein